MPPLFLTIKLNTSFENGASGAVESINIVTEKKQKDIDVKLNYSITLGPNLLSKYNQIHFASAAGFIRIALPDLFLPNYQYFELSPSKPVYTFSDVQKIKSTYQGNVCDFVLDYGTDISYIYDTEAGKHQYTVTTFVIENDELYIVDDLQTWRDSIYPDFGTIETDIYSGVNLSVEIVIELN